MVKPIFLSDAIDECLDKRNVVKEYDDNEDYIEITPDVYDAVMDPAGYPSRNTYKVIIIIDRLEEEYTF